jgi:hypothetical protein
MFTALPILIYKAAGTSNIYFIVSDSLILTSFFLIKIYLTAHQNIFLQCILLLQIFVLKILD